MPRYVLDMTFEHDNSLDEEGLEFATLETARTEAKRALSEMVGDGSISDNAAMQIRNGTGEVVCTVRLSDADC